MVTTVTDSTGAPLALGSRVMLARSALGGDPTHPMARSVGSIVNLAPFGADRTIAAVQWGDGPGSRAFTSRLVRVDRLSVERY